MVGAYRRTAAAEVIRDHDRAGALAAARALATFREDTALVEQVRAAAGARKDRASAREIEAVLAD